MFFFSSRRRHTRCGRDWSSDVCSSDLKKRKRVVQEEAVVQLTLKLLQLKEQQRKKLNRKQKRKRLKPKRKLLKKQSLKQKKKLLKKLKKKMKLLKKRIKKTIKKRNNLHCYKLLRGCHNFRQPLFLFITIYFAILCFKYI